MVQSGVWDPNFAGFHCVLLVLPSMRPSILLGTGDAYGLAARLGWVVSMAVASKSKPGPGTRTEHFQGLSQSFLGKSHVAGEGLNCLAPPGMPAERL